MLFCNLVLGYLNKAVENKLE